MKKLLFAAVTLDVGGIETALVTLINYLAEDKNGDNYKYDITLVLEKKQGIFLDTINKRINIIEYTPSKIKNPLIRKTINFIKQMKFSAKYKDRYDFSASYATYSLPASFVARTASTNAVLWCHMDYLAQYNGNKQLVKEFFKKLNYSKFKNLIFVSEKSRDTFLEVFTDMRGKAIYIDNLINYKSIQEKAKEKIDDEDMKLISKNENKTIFLNIGRHDEGQKKLSRIIEATRLLVKTEKNFKILFVGDGQDTEEYKKMVNENELKNEIIFLGRKKNPYPYFEIADCLLLTSEYEGSPVVFTETMILNKPIITTEVAGVKQIENRFGIVVNKEPEDICNAMKEFIKNGYCIKNKFDPEKYNNTIKNEVEKVIERV